MSLYLVNQCYNGFPCFVINCFEIWKPFIWPDPLTFSVVHGLLSWGKIVLFHWLDHFQLVFLGSIFNRQSFLPPFFPLMLKKKQLALCFFHVFNVLVCFFWEECPRLLWREACYQVDNSPAYISLIDPLGLTAQH